MNSAVIFPGQGSQHLGMLADLYQSDSQTKKIFTKANQILGYDLRQIIDYEENKLNQTQYTQPALFVCSFALWQKIKNKVKAKVLAGHSLGEYNALVASQALSFETGLALVAKRAQLMSQSGQSRKGAMAAVIGLNSQKINQICQSFTNKVQVANYNSIEQTVISGEIEAVSICSEKLKEQGAKRVIALSVSIASHSLLMKTAADLLADYLKTIPIQKPTIPIIHNVNCQSYDNPKQIKQALIDQLYQSVQWVQTMQIMQKNYKINHLIECGPNKILTNLVKRAGLFEKISNINNQESINLF